MELAVPNQNLRFRVADLNENKRLTKLSFALRELFCEVLNNPEFISKKTRNEFREYFSDNSVLRLIEQEFDSADIERNTDHGSNLLRRASVDG